MFHILDFIFPLFFSSAPILCFIFHMGVIHFFLFIPIHARCIAIAFFSLSFIVVLVIFTKVTNTNFIWTSGTFDHLPYATFGCDLTWQVHTYYRTFLRLTINQIYVICYCPVFLLFFPEAVKVDWLEILYVN